MLTSCEGCGRHIRETEARCPFCRAPASPLTKAFQAVGGIVTTVVLAACYGPPSGPIDTADTGGDTHTTETGGVDADGDGYFTPDDCDDDNDQVHPGATEICDDGIDNDCDGQIDADDEDCATSE